MPRNKKRDLEQILTKRIKNPQTGRKVLISTALSYDEDHPAHKKALKIINRLKLTVSDKAISKVNDVAQRFNRSIQAWSEEEKKFFKSGQQKPGSESRRGAADWIRRKAAGIVKGVKRELKHQGHAFKHAAAAIKGLTKGKKLTAEEMKALKHVGITIGLTIGTMAGTGALTHAIHHGAHILTKHIAIHLAEHIAAEAAILGVGKASLFADTATEMSDNQAIEMLVKKIADVMESGKIPPEVYLKAIESYNKEVHGN